MRALLALFTKLVSDGFRRSAKVTSQENLESTQAFENDMQNPAVAKAAGKHELRVNEVLAGRFRISAFIARGGINTGVEELDLGISFHQRGMHNEARAHLNECLSVLRGIGPRFRAHALPELASIEIDEHNAAAARKLLAGAFENERSLQETETMPKLLMTAGRLSRATGALDQAAKDYEKALKMFTDSAQKGEAAQAHTGLAEVDLDRKQYAIAETLARQSLAEFEREGRIVDAAHARAVAALCLLRRGDSRAAREMLAPARDIARRLEDPHIRDYIRAAEAQMAATTKPAR